MLIFLREFPHESCQPFTHPADIVYCVSFILTQKKIIRSLNNRQSGKISFYDPIRKCGLTRLRLYDMSCTCRISKKTFYDMS
ncbi:MAG: hypothetical protein WCJ01_01955, partial [Ignavibacteria bacterium]